MDESTESKGKVQFPGENPLGPYPPLFDLKLVYSYIIEVPDSEYDFDLFSTTLVSKILLFLRIRVSYIFQYNYQYNPQKPS